MKKIKAFFIKVHEDVFSGDAMELLIIGAGFGTIGSIIPFCLSVLGLSMCLVNIFFCSPEAFTSLENIDIRLMAWIFGVGTVSLGGAVLFWILAGVLTAWIYIWHAVMNLLYSVVNTLFKTKSLVC